MTATACGGGFRPQIHIASGLNTDVPFRCDACRLTGHVPPGHQRHLVACGHRATLCAALMAFAATLAAALFVTRRVQVQIIDRHQLRGVTRIDGTGRHVQIVARLHYRVTARRDAAALMSCG